MAEACPVRFLPLIIAGIVLLLLGLLWVPALSGQGHILAGAATGFAALLVALTISALRGGDPSVRRPAVSPVPAVVPESPAAAAASHAKGTEAIGLLAAFQENGRLVDFLMDDIAAYDDAQVGAAARIVHQGCRTVLDQNFAVKPACESAEGAIISVPKSYCGDEYRLSGSLVGEPPFTGTVVHRGWKASMLRLPRTVAPAGRVPNIAPTEVEVKVEARGRNKGHD